MKIVVITQDPASERMTEFTQAMADQGITEFETREGVDVSPALDAEGNIDEDHEHAKLYRIRRPGTSKGQVGCTIAHHNLWQEIKDQEDNYLILEDDARALPAIDLAAAEAALAGDVVMLHLYHEGLEPADLDANADAFLPVISVTKRVSTGSIAYVVSPAGADFLLKNLNRPKVKGDPPYFNQPVDGFMHTVINNAFFRTLVPREVMFAHSGLESTIASNDWWVKPPEPVEKTLDQRKTEAIRNIQQDALETVAAGITVADGVTLLCQAKDRELFSQMLVGMQGKLQLSPDEPTKTAILAAPFQVFDINGDPVDSTVGQVLEWFIGNGGYFDQFVPMHNVPTARAKQVNATESIEELDALLESWSAP